MVARGKLGVLLVLVFALCFAHATDSEIEEADRTFWGKLAAVFNTGSENANVGAAGANNVGGEAAVEESENGPGVSDGAGMTGAGNQGNAGDFGDIVLDKVIFPHRVLDAFKENTENSTENEDISGPQPVNKVCDLQMDRGPCRGYFRKFYFDKFTGECAMFVFGGCKGNDNRFSTMEDCKKTCSSFPKPEVTERPMQINVCKLPKVSGPCTGQFRQYYYYPYTSKCELVFGGCLSGGNRFDSLEKCESLCVPESERLVVKSTLPPGYSGPVTDGGQVVDVSVILEPTNPNCSLPKDAGLCYGYFLSYFYNIMTTKCESFVYGGCQGNANRFPSLKECERACVSKIETDVVNIVVGPESEGKDGGENGEVNKKVLCAPPVTDIGGGVPCLRSFIKYYFNSTTDKCEVVYGACNGYGDLFDSPGYCENVCLPVSTTSPPVTPADSSRDVGIQPTQNDNVCELERDSGPCYAAFKMFFYNKSTKKCEPFLYGGCRGNQNRFMSVTLCQQRCLQTTEMLEVTSISPVVTDVCSLKLDRGPCRATLTKFFFNAETKKCEEFVYGGCVGNDNRFDSLKDCEDKCAPKPSATTLSMPVDVCSLGPETGPCKAAFTYYYYNPSTGKCEAFLYGGCKGNGNRFATVGMCEMICAMSVVDEGTVVPVTPSPSTAPDDKKVNITSVVLPVDICLLDVEIGPCRAVFRNFFFNSKTSKCEEFLYGGCKGNGNRFLTVGMCEMICMPEERSIEVPAQPTESALTTTATPAIPNACSIGPDTGPCKASFLRYFYNPVSNKCEEFLYGGCRGNGNRFNTVEMCEMICVTASGDGNENQDTTVRPSAEPTDEGDEEPSAQPADQSTESPSAEPAYRSTASTVAEPSTKPTDMSTESPTAEPSAEPTNLPSESSSVEPTDLSSESPAAEPSAEPTDQPTESPDTEPSVANQSTETSASTVSQNSTMMGFNTTRAMPKDTTPPMPADRCSMRKDHGPCFGLFKQYFFDKSSGKCRKFMYGGCKGNDNRFDSSAECEKACAPVPAALERMGFNTPASTTTRTRDVCLLPRRAGPCYANIRRYFYNNESEKCEEFSFGGCLGNENRFEMLEQCEERCVIRPTAPPCVMSSACPVCMEEVPKRIFPVFCLANNAYKTTIRKASTESWPLKIQADLRPAQKMPMGLYTKWVLPDECECPILANVGNKVVLLVGKNTQLLRVPDSRTRALIYLNNDVTVLPLTIDLERTIFKGHKTNECDYQSADKKPQNSKK
ncbi:papilin-like [Lineus longissimus]|uniref:papilin-like n=1 Tax=Lineus longissimus TaxID=88925 RepID=UPI00315D2AA2